MTNPVVEDVSGLPNPSANTIPLPKRRKRTRHFAGKFKVPGGPVKNGKIY